MKNQNHKAFSLIELSVVLMVVALIVSSIIGGRMMIKNAKILKLVSETSLYIKEFVNFETRYGAYPGDFEKANEVFGTTDINGNTINNGDGDDLIGSDDYTDSESAGFFHHLYVSNIVDYPEFTGIAPTVVEGVEGVIINSNFPETSFGRSTFFYLANNDAEGRYVRTNTIVIGTKDQTKQNIMTPDDAESFDIKIDDGNPFKGEVIAYSESLADGTNEDDSTCTDIHGYNTSIKVEGCNSYRNIRGADIAFSEDIKENYPDFGKIDDDEDGGVSGLDSCDSAPSDPVITGFASWNTASLPVASGGSISGTCSSGYSSTVSALCTDGSWGTATGTCLADGCTVPLESATGYENITAWIDAGDLSSLSFGEGVDDGTTIQGTCANGYSGTPETTCTTGSWGSLSESCSQTSCAIPSEGATGYENIASWINKSDNSQLSFEEMMDEGTTIIGVCGSGYSGAPETTCTTVPNWDAMIGTCDSGNCVSSICTANGSFYCGDNWNCSSSTCCNNTMTGTGSDYITGDCYNNCLNATMGRDSISNVYAAYGDCVQDCDTGNTMGNDTITNATEAYGDCNFRCSDKMGNDTISNSDTAYGDCYSYCDGTLGDDTINNSNTAFGDCSGYCQGTMGNDIINTADEGHGDCYAACNGVMGNDTLIDVDDASGDCHQSCGTITSWATDIFRYTGSSTATIKDFNAGGVDDKVELPSGITVSLSGTGYSRTLTYTGNYSGTIAIQCDSGEHDCDEGGSWAVNTCQIYVGGTSLSSDQTPCGGDCSSVGFDTGTCNFN